MQRKLFAAVSALVIGLSLGALPVAPNLENGTLDSAAAWAKAGGNGGGQGNGGGNGGGNAGGNGGQGNGGGNAGGNGKGGGPEVAGKSDRGVDKPDKALGRDKADRGAKGGSSKGIGRALGKADAVSGLSDDHDDTDTGKTDKSAKTASKLGRLNAAHASPTARANAAPHSAVGQIAALEAAELDAIDAAIAGDDAALAEAIAAAAEALAAAANKDITDTTVNDVNDLLGVDIEADLADAGIADPSTTAADIESDIQNQASDLQDAETNQGLGGTKGGYE